MSEPLRFCKDCKHFFSDEKNRGLCQHPEVMVTDLITGEKYDVLCVQARANFVEGVVVNEEQAPCGKTGKLYEAKP